MRPSPTPVDDVEDFGLVRQEKPDALELARCSDFSRKALTRALTLSGNCVAGLPALGKYRPDCIGFGDSLTVAVPGHGSDKIIVGEDRTRVGQKGICRPSCGNRSCKNTESRSWRAARRS